MLLQLISKSYSTVAFPYGPSLFQWLPTLKHEDFEKALFIEFGFLINVMELSKILDRILQNFQMFSHQKL